MKPPKPKVLKVWAVCCKSGEIHFDGHDIWVYGDKDDARDGAADLKSGGWDAAEDDPAFSADVCGPHSIQALESREEKR